MDSMSTEFNTKKELEEKRKHIETFEDLIKYLTDVSNNYNIGYGDAPRAIAQACLAVGYYFAKQFWITGFQAGFVMWDFILGWEKQNNKTALRLIDYDEMLFPQYAYKFEKTISSDIWEAIQKEASELLKSGDCCKEVCNHLQSIIDGNVPFGYTVSK